MRSSKSRSRNKSNRQRSLGNVVNRVFDSSGPEGKVRGTPQQIIEKYLTLARDAQLSNDRVAEQSFLQHAEHYTRMLGEAQREMAERQQQHQQHQQNHRQNGNGEDDSASNRDNGQNGRDHAPRDAGDRGGRDQSRRQEPAAEQSPAGPSQEAVPPAEGGGDSGADTALPDAVAHGEEDRAAPVETPEAEAKPARARTPRPRTPRSTTGRTRRKSADAAGEGETTTAPEPQGAGDNSEAG